MDDKFWARLNSPIIMWLVGTLLVGGVTSLVEGQITSRKRSQELNERFDRLRFEFSGRLSQYSGWFLYLLENPSDLVQPSSSIVLLRSYSGKASTRLRKDRMLSRFRFNMS
jgi:hypothetical protein